jgi:hypothetical protein
VSTLLVVVGFLVFLGLVSWACETYGPLVVLGGILLAAMVLA